MPESIFNRAQSRVCPTERPFVPVQGIVVRELPDGRVALRPCPGKCSRPAVPRPPDPPPKSSRMQILRYAQNDKQNAVSHAKGPQHGGTGIVEKICYALHNMPAFERRPPELKEKFFDILFKSAEIANFTPEQRKIYREDMANERDRINQLNWAKEEAAREGRAEGLAEGRAEGRAEGLKQGAEQGAEQAKLEAARNLKVLGVEIDIIVKATGLDKATVEAM